jgi:hypothetical protein
MFNKPTSGDFLLTRGKFAFSVTKPLTFFRLFSSVEMAIRRIRTSPDRLPRFRASLPDQTGSIPENSGKSGVCVLQLSNGRAHIYIITKQETLTEGEGSVQLTSCIR